MLNWNKIIVFLILTPVVILLLSGCHAHNPVYYSDHTYTPPIYTNDVNQRGFVTQDWTRNNYEVSRHKYNERYDLNYGEYTPKFGKGNNWGNTCKTRGTC